MPFESEPSPLPESGFGQHRKGRLDHLPALDGVRGIAILLVLLTHLSAILRDTMIGRYLDFGWIGVDLFFVLSGFLITRILLAGRNDLNYYRRFYIRRGLRIWPLYYTYVVVTLLLMRILAHFPAGFPTSTATPTWVFLLFLQNLNPASLFSFRDSLFSITWSLCIEEHFYLLWPGCVRVLTRRTLIACLGAILLLSPLLRIGASLVARNSPFSVWYQTVTRFTPLHLDAIAAGCLLSLLWTALPGEWSERRERLKTDNRDRWFGALFLSGLAGTVICLRFQSDPYLFSFCYSAVAVMFSGFVGFALTGHFAAFLNNSALRYLGRISYGVYLIHPSVFVFLQSHHLLGRLGLARHPTLVESGAALAAVTLSLALAALSWEFFEKRVLAWKRSLAP